MQKKSGHNIKMYNADEFENNVLEPDKLRAMFEECITFFDLTKEDMQERYAFKKVRIARWMFVYLAYMQGEGVFLNPAIGFLLDRYDNEVCALKKTACKNVPKIEYYRNILFTIVKALEAKGWNLQMPTNLANKYKYFLQNIKQSTIQQS